MENMWKALLTNIVGSQTRHIWEQPIYILIKPDEYMGETEESIHKGIDSVIRRLHASKENTDAVIKRFRHPTEYDRDTLNIAIEDYFETHDVGWGFTTDEVVSNMMKYRTFDINHTFFVSLSFQCNPGICAVHGTTTALKAPVERMLATDTSLN